MTIRLAFTLLDATAPPAMLTTHQVFKCGTLAPAPLREYALAYGRELDVVIHECLGLVLHWGCSHQRIEVCHADPCIPRWLELTFFKLVEGQPVELGRRRIRPGDADTLTLLPDEWVKLVELPHGVEGHLE